MYFFLLKVWLIQNSALYLRCKNKVTPNKSNNMTQKEFEDRTRLKVTEEDYKTIEETYMNTDLGKDTFCKLYSEYPAVLKEVERKTVQVRILYDERKKLANILVKLAEKLTRPIRQSTGGNHKSESIWDEVKKLLDEIRVLR